MLNFFILVVAALAVSIHGSKIHEQMTPDEVKLLFNTNHNEVPEYEVVPVAHGVHENSPEDSPHRIVQLRSFKRDIKLYLEPTEGYLAAKDMPVWKVEGDSRSPLGVKYTRLPNKKKGLVSQFYQDPYNFAAITSSYDINGEVLFEGTIGNDLVVRPLPERLRKEFARDKRSAYDEDFPQTNRSVYHPNLKHTYQHVVFKTKEISMDGIREKIGTYTLKQKSSRSKRSTDDDNDDETDSEIPKTIYPQVLVVVDYTEFLSLQTLDEVKRYVISFWNAVDLRYRVFRNPEIRLNIVGIIIATDPNGVPFIQKHRTRPNDGPIVDADLALDNMAEYFFNETMDDSLKRFVLEKDFDIVMAMTQLNLCNLEPIDKDFDCTTLGYAFRGGGCTVNMKKTFMESVGIVEDNGGYIGIIPAAHEVGHILGAPHDGTEPKDEMRCPKFGGYIMTGMLMLTENVFMWSRCSVEYFQDFFHSPRATCLFDQPRKARGVRRVLPGSILTLDEQCDRIQGTHACNKDESACIHLDCFVPNSGGQCLPVAPAAEGSSCGKHNYCINGKCVNKKNTTDVLLQFAPPPSSERPFFDDLEGSIQIEKN